MGQRWRSELLFFEVASSMGWFVCLLSVHTQSQVGLQCNMERGRGCDV